MAASSVYEIDLDDARDICKQLGVTKAKKADGNVLAKLLKTAVKNAEEDGEIELDKQSRKMFDAIAKAKKVTISSDEEEEEEDDEEEDEEEEETISKKTRGAKKKGAKKPKKKSGPTTKDQIFELWLKYQDDPTKARKLAISKYGETVQTGTINRWMARWNGAEAPDSEVGFPRGAKGRNKEIREALKSIRMAMKSQKSKKKTSKKKSKDEDDE